MKLFNFSSKNFKILFTTLFILCIVGICMNGVSAADINAVDGGSSINDCTKNRISANVLSYNNVVDSDSIDDMVVPGDCIYDEPVLGAPNLVIKFKKC